MKKALCIIMLTAAFAASFFMRDYNIENRIWHADESEQRPGDEQNRIHLFSARIC